MTRAVVYALGGGQGHVARAARVAESFDAATIFHQAPRTPLAAAAHLVRVPPSWTITDLRAAMLDVASSSTTLVVDTFPGGIAHELDDSILAAFGERVLVRRYLKPSSYPDDERLAARYDRVLLPYAANACEWEGRVAGEYVGPLVRTITLNSAEESAVVIGDPETLPAGWRPHLVDAHVVDHAFSSLPRARHYLATAAGHNLTYELLAMGVNFALYPRERRYDDQYRRADRLGAGVYRRDDLVRWLETT